MNLLYRNRRYGEWRDKCLKSPSDKPVCNKHPSGSRRKIWWTALLSGVILAAIGVRLRWQQKSNRAIPPINQLEMDDSAASRDSKGTALTGR